MKDLILPQLVLNKLNALPNANALIDDLKKTIQFLENKRGIQFTQILSGGTSAFVSKAKMFDQSEVIIKIPFHKYDLGVDFINEISALKLVNGKGYVKLLKYEEELNVVFLESLGKPLGHLNYSINQQIHIICEVLKSSWIPVEEENSFPTTLETADWFTTYINGTWKELNQPFSKNLLKKVNQFIKNRKRNYHPKYARLVHGDAHNLNILQVPSGAKEQFKFIDPDGLLAEPAYDLGVLMREWPDELLVSPKKSLTKRLNLLSKLTGEDKAAIWEWGLIQTLATGLVLLQSNDLVESDKLFHLGKYWE